MKDTLSYFLVEIYTHLPDSVPLHSYLLCVQIFSHILARGNVLNIQHFFDRRARCAYRGEGGRDDGNSSSESSHSNILENECSVIEQNVTPIPAQIQEGAMCHPPSPVHHSKQYFFCLHGIGAIAGNTQLFFVDTYSTETRVRIMQESSGMWGRTV